MVVEEEKQSFMELERAVQLLKAALEKERTERSKLENECSLLRKRLQNEKPPSSQELHMDEELTKERNANLDLNQKLRDTEQQYLNEKIQKDEWKQKYQSLM